MIFIVIEKLEVNQRISTRNFILTLKFSNYFLRSILYIFLRCYNNFSENHFLSNTSLLLQFTNTIEYWQFILWKSTTAPRLWFHDFPRHMFAIASGKTLFLFSGPVAEWNISKGPPTHLTRHKIHNHSCRLILG